MVDILGHGVYSLSEAARLTRLKPHRIREWFRIRGEGSSPVLRSRYENSNNGETAIGFLDLVDVFVAGQLRTRGVSVQTVRKVYNSLAARLDTKHPFSKKEMLTDGSIVYVGNLNEQGEREVSEALSGQGVFPQVILPFLKQIDYDKATTLALRWHATNDVVLDPALCFGQPIIKNASIPTRILYESYLANNCDKYMVANWFDVQPGQVAAAVEFEGSFAA